MYANNVDPGSDIYANNIDPDERAHYELMSGLIKIHTVCYFDFCLRHLYGTMVLTRFKDGRVHLRNSGMKVGVVGWCEIYLRSPVRLTDIGLQFGKAFYPCSR